MSTIFNKHCLKYTKKTYYFLDKGITNDIYILCDARINKLKKYYLFN